MHVSGTMAMLWLNYGHLFFIFIICCGGTSKFSLNGDDWILTEHVTNISGESSVCHWFLWPILYL